MEFLEENIRKRQFKQVLQQCEEGEILNPSGYATTEVYMVMLGCYLATDELEQSSSGLEYLKVSRRTTQS